MVGPVRTSSCWRVLVRATLPVVCGLAIQGCGGGSSGAATASEPPPSGWTPGVFLPAEGFAAQCAVPRSGVDPYTEAPYPDRQGSRLDENNWLRSWSHELYLWYDEITDRDPAAYSTRAYFDLMRTFAVTGTGRPRDRYHFALPTDAWRALSQSGESAGYGVQWAVLSAATPRDVRVAYTQPGSPAADHGLVRGARVIAVNGRDIVHAQDPDTVALLGEALFPTQAGAVYTFDVVDAGAATTRALTLVSTTVTLVPVQDAAVIETATGRVGYLHFTDHIATAEAALFEAFSDLAAAGVDDLVLDLRYNGGGSLAIASQLAFMIAGEAATAGRTFERMHFNDKHPTTNPVTGQPLGPLPFLDFTLGFSVEPLTPLPSLDLPRVFVLTGGSTCSASESLINALRGIDVEVIQVGAGTCGKPYGFYPADNCGTTYFSIQFQVTNEKGFGDYADGFSPDPSAVNAGAVTAGCIAIDDFLHPLGDPAEARLAAALAYRETGTCPSSGAAAAASKPAGAAPPATEPLVPKPPALQIRILDAL